MTKENHYLSAVLFLFPDPRTREDERTRGKDRIIYTTKGLLDGKIKEVLEKARHWTSPPLISTTRMSICFPYYNVRAGRARMGDREMVVGEARQEKRKEAGFDLAGDGRVRQAIMRHRLDVLLNVTCSFDPVTLRCSGCKERGVHSVVRGERGEPVVLVVTDQNFPAVLYSGNKEPCIGVVRAEHGSIREIGFMVSDLLDGVALAPGR